MDHLCSDCKVAKPHYEPMYGVYWEKCVNCTNEEGWKHKVAAAKKRIAKAERNGDDEAAAELEKSINDGAKAEFLARKAAGHAKAARYL